jgi:hypothetical protein
VRARPAGGRALTAAASALWALAAASAWGPPPAEGGRRPHKVPPTRIQKLLASNWYNLYNFLGYFRRKYARPAPTLSRAFLYGRAAPT